LDSIPCGGCEPRYTIWRANAAGTSSAARRSIEHLNATVRDAIKDTEDLPKTVLMLLFGSHQDFLKRHPIV